MASGEEGSPGGMRKRTQTMIKGNQYYVESIIGERTDDGELRYLVKWEGYPPDEASWEPADNLHEDHIAQWVKDKAELEEMTEQEEKEEKSFEKILAERETADGDAEFLVKWKGYPVEEATWELAGDVNEDDIAQWDDQSSSEEMTVNDGDQPRGQDKDAGSRAPEPEEAPTPPSENLVRATSGEGLPPQGPDSIIGVDETRFLVLQGPHPVSGEPRKPTWLLHSLVSRDKVREWEQLRQTMLDGIDNLLKTEDYKSSYGAIFFYLYDYRRIRRSKSSRGALFIQKRPEAGTDTLGDLLASIGVFVGQPVMLSEYRPESHPSDQPAVGEDPGGLEQESRIRQANDEDDEMDEDDTNEEDLVSDPKFLGEDADREEKCTNDSRINTADASELNQEVTVTQELINLDDASSEADAEWVLDEDLYPSYVSRENWATQQWEEPLLFPTTIDIEADE